MLKSIYPSAKHKEVIWTLNDYKKYLENTQSQDTFKEVEADFLAYLEKNVPQVEPGRGSAILNEILMKVKKLSSQS